LGDPTRSIKTPASIAIRVNDVRNPPPRKVDGTQGYHATEKCGISSRFNSQSIHQMFF